MSLVLDAGALIGYERGNRVVQAFLLTAAETRTNVKTASAIIAQVWRDGARQAHLVQLLRGVEEIPLTPQRARAIGVLLRASRTTDVVDAAVIELADDGDEILTSDPGDLVQLVRHSGKSLTIVPVT